jgi:Holliday junction DNA helicase RuvA
VGKKTAARLLLDLKSRLEVPDLDLVDRDGRPPSVRADLGAALAGLGYQPDEVRDVLRELPPEGDVDALLRDALKLLAAAR